MSFSTSQRKKLRSPRAQPSAKQYPHTLQEQTLQRLSSPQNRYVLELPALLDHRRRRAASCPGWGCPVPLWRTWHVRAQASRAASAPARDTGLVWIAPSSSGQGQQISPAFTLNTFNSGQKEFWKNVLFSQHSWLKNKPQKRLVFPFNKKRQEKEAQHRNATSIKILIICCLEAGKAVPWLLSATIRSGFRSCALNYYLLWTDLALPSN